MHEKMRMFAVTFAAVLGLMAVGLTAVAAADGAYYIHGTMGNGVRVHTGPHVAAPVVGNPLQDGASINIICQTYGDTVTDPGTGKSSVIWDRIGTNREDRYISDLYASTPNVGTLSPGLAECRSGSAGSGTGPPPRTACGWRPANNANVLGKIAYDFFNLPQYYLRSGPDTSCAVVVSHWPNGSVDGDVVGVHCGHKDDNGKWWDYVDDQEVIGDSVLPVIYGWIPDQDVRWSGHGVSC
jgi:hypothetical protein